MKYGLMAVAVLLLTACVFFIPSTPEAEAWDTVCEIQDTYSCVGVEMPLVIVEALEPGLYGYYDGGDSIHITAGLSIEQHMATLIHEMIHYLQIHHLNIELPNYGSVICPLEDEAFEITDQWWESIGRGDRARGPDWWTAYPICWPYADQFARIQ